jgi:phosphoglycerate dehydrogenase-like enzyme
LSERTIVVAFTAPDDAVARLERAAPGIRVEIVPEIAEPDVVFPPKLAETCVALVTDWYLPANLSQLTALRWIQVGSTGYEQLVGHPLEAMGVRATTMSGTQDTAIAEWCIAMMLILNRDLPTMLVNAAARSYVREPRFQAELRGRRLGILGYGNIGRELARLARAHGVETWAASREEPGPLEGRFVAAGTGDPDGALPDRWLQVDELPEFLGGLDFLAVTLPLNQATRGFLDDDRLALLPESAYLLNPARAEIVDEDALYQALRSEWIAGAALDAHYREPMPPDDRFWELPNVIVTPHVSGSGGTEPYYERAWTIICENLRRLDAGEPLLNEVPWPDLAGP